MGELENIYNLKVGTELKWNNHGTAYYIGKMDNRYIYVCWKSNPVAFVSYTKEGITGLIDKGHVTTLNKSTVLMDLLSILN